MLKRSHQVPQNVPGFGGKGLKKVRWGHWTGPNPGGPSFKEVRAQTRTEGRAGQRVWERTSQGGGLLTPHLTFLPPESRGGTFLVLGGPGAPRHRPAADPWMSPGASYPLGVTSICTTQPFFLFSIPPLPEYTFVLMCFHSDEALPFFLGCSRSNMYY